MCICWPNIYVWSKFGRNRFTGLDVRVYSAPKKTTVPVFKTNNVKA